MRTRLLALPIAALALAVFTGCTPAASDAGSSSTPDASTSASADGTCTYPDAAGSVKEGTTAPAAEPTVTGDAAATMKTSAGDIAITLDGKRTPCTVNSFASLASQKYFDATQCHRLTTSGIFVLQCGDPSGTGMGGPGYSFPDEVDGSETYPAGTVAMANAGPDTNGSQFFLVYEDSQLPPNYTVFGKMDAKGLDTVKAIAAKGVATGGNSSGDGAPAEKVTIESVTVG